MQSREQEISSVIPRQYEGMPSEIVEELWQNPIYIDDAKNKSENERRRIALEAIKKRELEEANLIRKELGIPLQNIQTENTISRNEWNENGITDEDYTEFKVKNGETDVGVYWYEYTNAAGKKLKESGKLEWGKERIYFDIPLNDMEKLRDLAFQVAKNEKIPITFKHLDVQKTEQVDLRQDSKTTRFVANFASVDDAKKFYKAIQQNEEYQKIKSDRNLDYNGFNIDGVAHYASGYREKREPLKRIVETAQKNLDDTYSYYSADGLKKITINKNEYDNFVKQFNAIPDPKEVWGKTNF